MSDGTYKMFMLANVSSSAKILLLLLLHTEYLTSEIFSWLKMSNYGFGGPANLICLNFVCMLFEGEILWFSLV